MPCPSQTSGFNVPNYVRPAQLNDYDGDDGDGDGSSDFMSMHFLCDVLAPSYTNDDEKWHPTPTVGSENGSPMFDLPAILIILQENIPNETHDKIPKLMSASGSHLSGRTIREEPQVRTFGSRTRSRGRWCEATIRGIMPERLWGEHVTDTAGKAWRALHFVMRVLRKVSGKSKEIAYKSLVRPVMEYGAACWDPYRLEHIKTLEKIQKRALKCCRKNSPLKWDTLTDRRTRIRLCALFKTYRVSSRQGCQGQKHVLDSPCFKALSGCDESILQAVVVIKKGWVSSSRN
ncbi:hypothetical protein ANN_23090 [Periplaneta americana]|uniref:Uncharacterized protein n=1 Tax=Periplaneta americana TaxID=6978 RepID=A0ABQ8SKJ5_PERAM|nr:hypothetical protein ANN_23090 [Periplaneta americana]